MKAYPHRYAIGAVGGPAGEITLAGAGLPALASAPPVEFDGPGDLWSPETLLVAAVADCFVLSFRAIARASQLEWLELDVEVVGTLDRVERQPRFTRFDTRAHLRLPVGGDRVRAEAALARAEAVCLISNSLSGERHLQAQVGLADEDD